jgi:hypothetical protein
MILPSITPTQHIDSTHTADMSTGLNEDDFELIKPELSIFTEVFLLPDLVLELDRNIMVTTIIPFYHEIQTSHG